MPYFALLDDAASGRAKLYQNHRQSIFLRGSQAEKLDDLLAEGWQNGHHAVLFLHYEAGLPLQNLPGQPQSDVFALHWFADCEAVNAETWLQQNSDGMPCGISTPQSNTGQTDYLNRIHQIHEAIKRGDTYQINYTTRLHVQAYGNPIDLYRRLRQPVPYAALSCLPDASGDKNWTLCFSPELFLNISSNGIITSEPMKGTAPILNDGRDAERAAELQNDSKNRAENVMIVDLLRNDLGKIAETGGVRVPDPFRVSPFGSVWQMTSAVEARAKPHIRASDILHAAFPCGSITGAPKRMSMQIINDLETEPRGIYTGSIGFLNPCTSGLGFEGTLNVVIRTLTLRPSEHPYVYGGIYGVGSGIVIDSDPQAEYEECGWKARFLTQLRPEFGIFETLKVSANRCTLLTRHLNRLQTSAYALNLPLPVDFATQIQDYIAHMPSESCRLKISLNSDGMGFVHAPLAEFSESQTVVISEQILQPRDYLRRFKTGRRETFDQAWQQAEQQGAFDGLLFDSDGFLLEGGRSSVFVKINGEWHTPPLDSDILNGVMRQEIFSHPQKYLAADRVFESRITREMLQTAEQIRLSNALRGVFEVKLISK